MKIADGLAGLHASADMQSWREMIEGDAEDLKIETGLDPAIYALVFGSPEGVMVLEDMYAKYVNVTRAVPGAGADAAFYREGMAQVVFDIVHQMSKAYQGDNDDG